MLLVYLEGEDYSLVVSVGENCRLILDGKKSKFIYLLIGLLS